MSPQEITFATTSSGITSEICAQALTDFISANLIVVKRVNEPIFRVNDLYWSFDATVIQRENNTSADNVDEIDVQDVCGMEMKFGNEHYGGFVLNQVTRLS